MNNKNMPHLWVVDGEEYQSTTLAGAAIGVHKDTILYRYKNNTHGYKKIENPNYVKFDIRLHQQWQDMIKRCYNPEREEYRFYGAKGIIVCDEWRNSSYDYCRWARKNGYADDLTIERKNSAGNYEPSNCHFILQEDQWRTQLTAKRWCVHGIWFESLRKAGEHYKRTPVTIMNWCDGYISRKSGNWIPPRSGCYSELVFV